MKLVGSRAGDDIGGRPGITAEFRIGSVRQDLELRDGVNGRLQHKPAVHPVEIISTTARLLSLTVRLWANMFASDLIYVIFLGLLGEGAAFGWSKSPVLVILGIFPAVIPIAFIALHIFVSVVQAYVFTVLPSVYLGLATSDEH